jgi:hypothetical protein
MITLRQFIANVNEFAAANPDALDLPLVATDDQCAHFDVTGNVFVEDVADWPSEYCIEESLPDGCTKFARL